MRRCRKIDERTLQVDGGAVSLHHPVDEAVRHCSLVADALRRAGERGPPRRHRRRHCVDCEGDDETVEAIFAQARDAEASAEEYLVDGDGNAVKRTVSLQVLCHDLRHQHRGLAGLPFWDGYISSSSFLSLFSSATNKGGGPS